MATKAPGNKVRAVNKHRIAAFLRSLIPCACLLLLIYFVITVELDSRTALLVTCGLSFFTVIGLWYLASLQPSADVTSMASPVAIKNAAKPKSDEESPEANPFDLLVQDAINAIPDEFQKQMDNLAILIEDEPDTETLAHVGVGEGQILLGLYQGVPLTSYGQRYALLPERITIYQHNIERYCHGDPERIRAQVKKTVLHEIAHHFGMGHETMPIWVR